MLAPVTKELYELLARFAAIDESLEVTIMIVNGGVFMDM